MESFGNPDDFIGYHFFLLGAADPRVENDLVIPGAPNTIISAFEELQFQFDSNPLIFQGDNATYEVAASLTETSSREEIPVGELNINSLSLIAYDSSTPFDARVSTGTDVTYDWDWGDGTTGTCATANHVYTIPGIYTVQVTASNRTSSETRAVEVHVAESIHHAFLPTIQSSLVAK